ncbi:hypothetical protein [Miltoncostaea marina]|uniref:hypothetical protein n=1 Tax=Miltoncostaea marina TaxID=2843215 RepID=UPI001C3DD099|nr:hypothetical protein [Miltoncostaea marina]
MGIEDEVAHLLQTESAKHKRLVDYVAGQLSAGRDLRQVMEDPYVTNRISVVERRALLDEPKIVEAAGDDVLASMRARLEALHREGG